MAATKKAQEVAKLLNAKKVSKKSFTEIGKELGLTNVYVAQLFHRQAQLQPGSVEALRAAVPHLTDADLATLTEIPLRSFDPSIIQDPTIYRLYEIIMHYAESYKAIINEELGDGIMSGISFQSHVEKVKGKDGEDRVLITLDGRFLPHSEQAL